MTTDNKAIIRKLFEQVHHNKNFAVLDEIVAADFVAHDMAPGNPHAKGPAALRYNIELVQKSMPDQKTAIADLVGEGDMVAARVLVEGTDSVGVLNRPATNKSVKAEGLTLFRLKGGKIVEQWSKFDRMALISQLGPS
jgi:predicted ester cyclase